QPVVPRHVRYCHVMLIQHSREPGRPTLRRRIDSTISVCRRQHHERRVRDVVPAVRVEVVYLLLKRSLRRLFVALSQPRHRINGRLWCHEFFSLRTILPLPGIAAQSEMQGVREKPFVILAAQSWDRRENTPTRGPGVGYGRAEPTVAIN